MALPTYKKQTQQVAVPQQVRSGDNADAGMLASAQANQTLAQKLSQFSQNLTGVAKGMAQSEAAKNATADVLKRKQKIEDINSEYRGRALTEDEKEERRSRIAEIKEGADRVFSGTYSRAYESAASSAYSNQVAADAKSAYDLAIMNSGGDPEVFMKSYGAFSSETVAGAPTEATSILAQQTTMKYGTAGYKSLMMAKMGANKKANKTTHKDNMSAISQQFSGAYYSGDSVEISRLGALATSASEAAVRDGLITQAEHEVNLSNMSDRAVMDSVNRKFGEEVNVGRGDIVYMQFRQAERNGDFESFDPEEIAKTKSSMLKQIKEFNDSTLERARFEKESFESISDDTFRQGTQDAANGSLTEAQITDWEKGGVLSTSHADSLRERISVGATRKVSDAQSLSRFAESTVLLDTDNYLILEDPSLSETDKTNLIKRKETLLEGRFNWVKTNDGREAIRRIKSNFGILEGTLMAKLDLNNTTMRDFDNMYKEFYAEVSQSPNPDLDALPIADSLLAKYAQKQADKDAKAKQEREARKLEEAKNAAAAANDSLMVKIGWKSEVTPEQMMLEN